MEGSAATEAAHPSAPGLAYTANPSSDPRVRRGWLKQQSRRAHEQCYRQRVAEAVETCASWTTRREACRCLNVSPRTVRHWRSRSHESPKPRGRRRKTATVAQRNQVIDFLHHVTGPVVGLPTLRAVFPELPRCLTAELLRRYRRAWRRRYRRQGFRLTWHQPNSVWAMDHSQATQLIDGRCEQIFAVRDLASHRQLAWAAVHSTDAAEACALLTDLFTRHGPPLVMKSDQGSAFVGERMTELLAQWEVTPLLSPKGTPQYNGALERANSTHKAFTHQQALREEHPAYWTTANLAAARRLANAISRPWGHSGPSPDTCWQQRAPLTNAQRRQFQSELVAQRQAARRELGLDSCSEPTRLQRDRLERRATSAALEQLGYLTKHPVRRPPRKAKRRCAAQLQKALKQQREQVEDLEVASVARTETNFALASTEARATMRAVNAVAAHDATAPSSRSAHPEPTQPQGWRRIIALAINVAKAANITR